MYLLFYGLTQEPFHTTPDPEFLYLSPSHKEALASIIYGIERRKGFVAVIGEVGVGKTTVLRSFIEKVDPARERAIYLLNPRLTFTSLLRNMLSELGEEAKNLNDDEMVRRLHEVLIEEYKQDRTVILIIDEAQNVPLATLEQLRMLSNLETSMDKLLQIILIGQPEFDDILKRHELRQLRQRIAIRSTIRPLSEKDSLAYILYRLDRVKTKDAPIFTKGAMKLIVEQAEGIPRRINILCDNALITGFGYQQIPVTSKIVREVIADMEESTIFKLTRWVPLAVGMLLLVILAGIFFIGKERWIPDGLLRLVSSQSQEGASQEVVEVKMRNGAAPSIASLPPNVPPGDSAASAEETRAPSSLDDPLQRARPTASSAPLTHNESGLDPLAGAGGFSPVDTFPVEEETEHVDQRLDGSSHNVKHFTKVVKKGDTLSRLIEKVYGFSNPSRVQWVLEKNPHIKNSWRIYPGQKVVFPEMEDGTP